MRLLLYYKHLETELKCTFTVSVVSTFLRHFSVSSDDNESLGKCTANREMKLFLDQTENSDILRSLKHERTDKSNWRCEGEKYFNKLHLLKSSAKE